MDKKIEYYQWFFSDQLQQMEIDQKTIINTPMAQLIQQGVVTMGYVDKTILEKGHIVLKFPKGYADTSEGSKIICRREEECFLNLWYSY